MLGVAEVPHRSPLDDVFAAVAQDMGVGHTFRLTPVGVFFGAPAGVTVPDPYFGGAGPPRTGCRECGECMTGCRHNAKNTLPKNYLGLAEAAGATVHPMTTVTGVRSLQGGGYAVDTVRTGPFARERRTFTAEHVVMAAGASNTQRLLHRMRDDGGHEGLQVVDGSAVSANLGVNPVAHHHGPGGAGDGVVAQSR